MNFKEALYVAGTNEALEAFGVRTAYDRGLGKKMPHGGQHIGAERLARALSDEKPYERPGEHANYRKLERPTRWGPVTNLDSDSFGQPGSYGSV